DGQDGELADRGDQGSAALDVTAADVEDGALPRVVGRLRLHPRERAALHGFPGNDAVDGAREAGVGQHAELEGLAALRRRIRPLDELREVIEEGRLDVVFERLLRRADRTRVVEPRSS